MTGEVRATAILYDEGEEMEVVGESHYQENFVKIVGPKTEEGHNRSVVAALVPEPENPHDPMAVEVRVDGRTVGHLPADVASEYQPVLLRLLEQQGCYAACHATIKGGWRRAGKDIGHFGITLTTFPPISAILASCANSSPSAETSAKVGGGCLGLVGFAALLLWAYAS